MAIHTEAIETEGAVTTHLYGTRHLALASSLSLTRRLGSTTDTGSCEWYTCVPNRPTDDSRQTMRRVPPSQTKYIQHPKLYSRSPSQKKERVRMDAHRAVGCIIFSVEIIAPVSYGYHRL